MQACNPALSDVQDSNPRIKSGEIPPYTGIANCFSRVTAEQGALEMLRLTCASLRASERSLIVDAVSCSRM